MLFFAKSNQKLRKMKLKFLSIIICAIAFAMLSTSCKSKKVLAKPAEEDKVVVEEPAKVIEPVKEKVVTQELRQDGYDGKVTTDDHGMHIVGLYTDQNGVNYFLVKNSWGTSNYPKGYLYVSENYFKYKTINIYLHKDGVKKDVRSKLNL